MLSLGPYDYRHLPVRFFMEAPDDAFSYAGYLGVLALVDNYRAIRDRELRAAELERGLARAQLENLRLQLQPHFLFNALNTISATMYDDPAAADAMVGQLAELLRHSLRTANVQEVSLGEELELLGNYVAIMRARFGDGLVIAVDVAPESRDG